MDKYEQFENLIRQELRAFGCHKQVSFQKLEKLDRKASEYKQVPYYHLNQLAMYFYSVLTRIVLPTPRKVILYNGFNAKGQKLGLQRLFHKVETGQSIIPNLSKFVFEADQAKLNDPMLAEWGIHHFHIPVDDGKKFFVNRTNELLFAIVTSDVFIPLDIQPHSDCSGTYEPWVDVDIFEKIERHFPTIIEHLKERQGVEPYTFEQRKALRSKGYSSKIITNSGNEYIAPGFGSLCSGHPTEIRRQVDLNMLYLQHKCRESDEVVFDSNYNLIVKSAL